MPSAETGIIIRKFSPQDKEQVRRISYETAFMGEPSANFFEGDEIIADALTLYFTDFEPQSCFVAESSGQVIGYLIGSKDAALMNTVFNKKILPRLLLKALRKGIFLKNKNILFFISFLRSLLKRELRDPDFSRLYPATLHLNIQRGFRGLGIGSQLISVYLDYIAKEKIRGVHFATISDKAQSFFMKQGFSQLFQGRRSYFRHLLHTDVQIFIYGKSLQ